MCKPQETKFSREMLPLYHRTTFKGELFVREKLTIRIMGAYCNSEQTKGFADLQSLLRDVATSR